MRKFWYLFLVTALGLALMAGLVVAKNYKEVGKAWLGVYTQTIDDEMADAFDLPVKEGVVINEVADDSPAEKAGLKEDDIIIRFNGAKIASAEELTEAVTKNGPGDRVRLTVMRDGNQIDLTATLAKRPAEEAEEEVRKEIRVFRQPGQKGDMFHWESSGDRPFIGVSLLDLSRQLGDFFGVTKGRGALIAEVREDSPAEKAGLKAGDVITAIDDEDVTDPGDVQELVAERKPDDTVLVTLMRNKAETKLSVVVGEDENGEEAYSWGGFDAPDISIHVPKFKGKSFTVPPAPGLDSEEFDDLRDEMKRLKDELKSLHKEMQDLRDKLR
ncbi:MAG TPA: PDZ domain-containing protein [Candidatus Deferrimicrobium sp.]|nr:PDZ domain-containing protein [Candidatus Deferrimicrobium sp.]